MKHFSSAKYTAGKDYRDSQTLPGLYCRQLPIAAALIGALSCYPQGSHAEQGDNENFFNPAFLSNDPHAVADLSRFQKNQQAPGEYRVDIYLNNEFVVTRSQLFNEKPAQDNTSEAVLDSSVDDGTGLVPCLKLKYIEALGVNTAAFDRLKAASDEECINLPASIPHASTSLDFDRQRLDITIPQAALLNQARGYIPPEQWDQGIPALLLNYNFTGSRVSGDTRNNSYFLNLNSGLNIGAWRLRDNSSWNYSQSRTQTNSDWQHASTYLERTIIPLRAALTLGDSRTNSDVFDSLSFRGLQLASDDNMLPDSMKGFAPTIRGIAKSNAQVTVRQNGYTIYQTYVPPGPFVVNDLYPTSSSGDLTVSIKEVDGSVSSYTVPYSAVPILQREGGLRYALTAARYRSSISSQTDPEFVQASVVRGIGHGFTVYGGGQVSDKYHAFAAGAGKNLGDWGAFSMDVTQANSKLADGSTHSGQSMRFLYAKSLNETGTNFQLLGYRYSTQGFYTLDETTYKKMKGYNYQTEDGLRSYGDYFNLRYAKKGKIQLNLSQQAGRNGSVFISASQQSYWHTDEKTALLQAGYAGTWNDVSYSLTYNYNKAQRQAGSDQVFAFNMSLPLGRWLFPDSNKPLYATLNNSTDKHGNMTQMAGLSGTTLRDNNLNYSVQQGYSNHIGGGANGNASLDYQGTYGNVSTGYSYSPGFRQLNYGLNGGVVLHEHGLTLSQPLGDTNVLIEAPGADGVSIENTTGVSTDWRGYAVVPYATTYRRNRVALDVTSLNTHTDIDDAVVNVVPTKGALVRAKFNARVGVRALMVLMHNGKPVPFGAMVSIPGNDNSGIVGDDGQAYLSGLPLTGTVKALWGQGAHQQCVAKYSLEEKSLHQAITRTKAECI